ncbi:MAG: CapA family protein [Actinomycetota bacterium]
MKLSRTFPVIAIICLMVLFSGCNPQEAIEEGQRGENIAEEEREDTPSIETEETIEETIEVKLFIGNQIPLSYRKIIRNTSKEIFDSVSMAETEDAADVVLNLNKATGEIPFSYVFVPVTDFFNVNDGIDWANFMRYWDGGESIGLDLAIEEDTLNMLEMFLGECKIDDLNIAEEEEIPGLLEDGDNFSIIPFNQLEKEHRVLAVDGMSVFDRELNTGDYPLAAGVAISGKDGMADKLKSKLMAIPITNRDPEKLLAINMTGVTAMVRGTANRMDKYGVLYPGEKIVDVLKDADITHISNEIPFVEGCTGARDNDLVFCSKPEYIELLRYVGTDVIELTGNHMNDYGHEWMNYTLDMYDEEKWPYFGGGRNLEDSYKPAIFEKGPNKVAFLGCNFFGPEYDWATDETPGSAPPNLEDFEQIISGYKQDGYNVIFTFQYVETYNYHPTEQQIIDFRRMLEAGASIVSGSQSHHPMGMEIREEGFINYGLGNLFFDQMRSLGMRQGIIAKHIFYDNKHINTVLITTMLEDYAQPRLTTEDERQQLLNSVFESSIR